MSFQGQTEDLEITQAYGGRKYVVNKQSFIMMCCVWITANNNPIVALVGFLPLQGFPLLTWGSEWQTTAWDLISVIITTAKKPQLEST